MKASVHPPALEPAELLWRDGIPESARFGDVYFNRDNGLSESRHVFIEANELPGRFADLKANTHFVIAETGFGTGLNFLSTWAEWKKHQPQTNSVLHFISFERFPLTTPDLSKALALWPELAPFADQLITQYPQLIKGTHRLLFDEGRVRLTLCFGDLLYGLGHLSFIADAWFLDGFAPSHNPDMWAENAISAIREHSKPGTTFATFTVAGRIRRSLETSGFKIQKLPGFGRKREMLAGKIVADTHPESQPTIKPIAIIGAGIAGSMLARNLAERGLPVLLIDKASHPGSAASGNPQGALYAKLGIEYNAQAELAATALTFSQRYYQPWQSDFWHPTGLLQLATTEQEEARQKKFCDRNQYPETFLTPVSADKATELAGITIKVPGLWFPQSGWLEPSKACQRLASHEQITPLYNRQVTRIERYGDEWILLDGQGTSHTVSRIVIACGHQTADIVPVTGELRLKPIRGQISYLPETSLNQPATVICGLKYLNPANKGQAVTGATFDLKSDNPRPTVEGHQENLDELFRMLPTLCTNESLQAGSLNGRVAFRCATHDYQPVAGELLTESGNPVEGVYLFTGLGSKGLVWAPLLAEYLADIITGQPPCLPDYLARRIETQRLYRKPKT
ncbi:bifunctional tRNA (5-methylaminomethyl-2-thiouridine)(34)-methyltransferase MnmD/FAD-dependent 5-carboxymethylaminomethyl-2-thiouridine(34) oxidoreductase MnmC [Marinobacter sp.]|uniref:bifunctional tRNA (5-methylaminomethyl-2-thiouridine)(34)-methyltransferase MnmD/FAD-dependent 5-carboxymethylaminomethyl-2-thiouridine(34) oxidoreductase MnmC n=1 Tax=Marinobacter sp. TaxID=50741 RepID=UPI003561EDBB